MSSGSAIVLRKATVASFSSTLLLALQSSSYVHTSNPNDIMISEELEVVAVTESWLKEGQDWQLNVPGYKCFRRDRGGSLRGGGVALLVEDCIIAVRREVWRI